jgi:hypothetical protein
MLSSRRVDRSTHAMEKKTERFLWVQEKVTNSDRHWRNADIDYFVGAP